MGSADQQAPLSNLTSIVTSTLEARGVLGKIRAELRANVFAAIHEQQQQSGGPGFPSLSGLQDSVGLIATQLIVELLQSCHLDYSLSVFVPEADLKDQPPNRGALAAALSLDSAGSEPLLVQLVRAAMVGDAPLPTGAQPMASSATAAGGASGGATGQPPSAKALSLSIAAPSEPAPLRASGPPTPPSPTSPVLPVLPPLSKPKSAGSALLSDLPPIPGRGGTVPPLAHGGASPPSASALSPVGEERALDERRLDALENKLAHLAGLPLRPAAAIGAPLAPLTSARSPPSSLGATHTAAGGGGGLGASSVSPSSATAGACLGAAADEVEEVIEDDIEEESFDDFEEDDGLSGSLSGPPLMQGQSPSQLPAAGRGRSRLSPLETSTVSVDESVSPGRLQRELQGLDLAESAERP